jgi:hypothetical protein
MTALTDYQQEATRILAVASRDDKLASGTPDMILADAGLDTRKVEVTLDAAVTVAEITADPDYKGQPRTDFTEEAQARIDAEELSRFRRFLYQAIRRQRGLFTPERLARLLSDLDLPQPVRVTRVDTHVRGRGTLHFTLPGEHTHEELKPQLAALAVDEDSAAVRGAFPDAMALPDEVPSLTLLEDWRWPDFDGEPIATA